jgi:dephospho-CoA kinase
LRIIGITGGIGSGKSTVASILSSLGAVIIDADKISTEVVRKGEPALMEIVDNFGSEILNNSKDLNREKLAQIVFNDNIKLDILNNITHKYIAYRIAEDIKNWKDEQQNAIKSQILVIDAAIPLEHGFIDSVEKIWVIFADEEVRIKRVMKRNNSSYEDVQARINSQMKYDDYFKLADLIIYNNLGVEELRFDVKNKFVQLQI